MPPPDPENPRQSAPTYKTPGVYVEEAGTAARSVQGVETGTAAFVGPAPAGPAGAASEPLGSFSAFQSVYGHGDGDASDISFSRSPRKTSKNYLASAARAFFENGGQRLYVSRVTSPDGKNTAPPTGGDYGRALRALESIRDVAVVAAPGGTIAGITGISSVAPIHAALMEHVGLPGAYRFAVLDPPPGCSSSDVEDLRASLDSINAALYYPWITIADPKASAQINVPPSGFLCGVYARTDAQQGVFKAPANQPLLGAVALERTIANLESDTLNALGVNCLRSFPGRGDLVWGARTISSDPEWKYVNVRRYFLYLEHSIDQGTQWAVFEPNNEQLWAAIRLSISNFLYNEWQRGAMQGAKPEQAFFVRCDRSTMTQNDLDNGRLICEIGVAALKPAEFVIFRIGQKTADTSS